MTPHHREVAPALSGGPDYSGFLFAQVWTEASGMTLSVISALARLNLDPSREAVRLATMPRAAAAIILSKAIANLPDPPPAVDVSGTAARLIKLLPDLSAAVRQTAAYSARSRAWGRWRVIPSLRWQLWLILILAGCVAYLWIAGGSVGRENGGSPAVPATGTQTMPLADSGRSAGRDDPQPDHPVAPRQ